MKLICGTTVARKKDKVGKEGKVSIREKMKNSMIRHIMFLLSVTLHFRVTFCS